jgi:cytidylate kinase
MQRVIGEAGDLVTEGRDQGTVVFPDADLKIYLVASAEVRARRRFEELSAKGTRTSMQEVLADVRQRDQADMARPVGALRKAADAIEVDTSDMTPDEVAEKIVALARQNLSVATRKVDRAKLGLEPGPNR